MKYLVLIAVLVAVYLLWRWQRSQDEAEQKASRRPPPPSPPPAPQLPQEMVRCAACDMHLPRSEALADARGLHYCSPEHRRQGGA